MIKAVLLSKTQQDSLSLLTKKYSKLMLPVANKPFLEYLLDFLKKWKIKELFICHHNDNFKDQYRNFIEEQNYTAKIHFYQQKITPSSASFLKKIADKLDDNKPFLVIEGCTFLDFDLSRFLEFHRTKNAIATIAAEPTTNKKNSSSAELEIGDDNKIQKIHFSNSYNDKRRSLKPCGVYLFHPRMLSYIKSESYFDIKEQLFPLLNKQNLPMYAYEIDGYCKEVGETGDYFELNHDILSKGIGFFQGNSENMLLRGENTKIAKSAFLLGPIIIGDDCIIEEGCKIIGPTVIGNRCKINQNVLIRESIIWDETLLSESNVVENSIITGGKHNPGPHNYRHSIVLSDTLNISDLELLNRDFTMNYIFKREPSIILRRMRLKTYELLKRLFDFASSLLLTILFSPLFIIISLIIKANSPGPAFFRQKRCGKDGKEFNMIKFRTMIDKAEKKREKLLSLNECDGPMFKIKNDPRITKVGKFLRKTYLDEFPQLINVLRGEMSLVGPRPLALEEMRYCPSWRNNRLKVKPGITGLWQISKYNRNSFYQWIKYDNQYIHNRSFWLDLKILFKTMIRVTSTKI
jgi:lipopolysaccharide/colanic/teichoic acid biosynthesis glycosyltransferase/NDP-sugar pyrophosphorylase family protein